MKTDIPIDKGDWQFCRFKRSDIARSIVQGGQNDERDY